MTSRGSRPSSRARTAFCWLPPESWRIGTVTLGVRTSYSAISRSQCRRARPKLIIPRRENFVRRNSFISRLSSTLSSSATAVAVAVLRDHCSAQLRERLVARGSRAAAVDLDLALAAGPASPSARRRAPPGRYRATPAIPNTSPSRTVRSRPSSARFSRSSSAHEGRAPRAPARPGRTHRALHPQGHLAADHHLRERALVGVRRVDGADDASVAQHGAAVREAEQLVELVRDEDDRLAVVRHAAQEPGEVVPLVWRERGGRLVENQDVGAAIEQLDDLDRAGACRRCRSSITASGSIREAELVASARRAAA